jgi:amidophosphoribosyltransferase
LERGHALIIKKNGKTSIEEVLAPREKKSCSFERIYFSRGSDASIYEERKNLGKLVFPKILKSIDSDISNTVFSYIPNTAETSFYGMTEAAEDLLNQQKTTKILAGGTKLSAERVTEILSERPRFEKIAIKDAKLRTFIADDSSRDDLVEHVYDITYGVVKPTDNLVIIDDSIVRGTTLKKSIIKILDRLSPKKIVVVSSAPQIRYPDCYGIDMARIEAFIAFKAAIALLKDTKQENIIDEVYKKSKAQESKKDNKIVNFVKEIYAPFTTEEVSAKIAEMLKTKDIKAAVEVIYQTVENLHIACPDNLGDWYFTGDYPTPGGNRVVNQAFINFYEGNDKRAY